MGGDGGSIPKWIDLAKTAAKKEVIPAANQRRERFRACALSGQPLSDDVVICPLGLLFNREAIIRALIEKSAPKYFRYIRGLKDLSKPNFTVNPTYDPSSESKMTAGGAVDVPRWVCPISGVPTNGVHRFQMLRECGCCLSEKVVRELAPTECPQCGEVVDASKALDLAPLEVDVPNLRDTLETNRKLERATRKARRAERAERTSETSDKATHSEEAKKKKKKKKREKKLKKKEDKKRTREEHETVAASKRRRQDDSGDVDVPEHATPSVYASLFTNAAERKRAEQDKNFLFTGGHGSRMIPDIG